MYYKRGIVTKIWNRLRQCTNSGNGIIIDETAVVINENCIVVSRTGVLIDELLYTNRWKFCTNGKNCLCDKIGETIGGTDVQNTWHFEVDDRTAMLTVKTCVLINGTGVLIDGNGVFIGGIDIVID